MKKNVVTGLVALFLLGSCDLFTPAFSKNLNNPADPTAPSYIAPAPTGLTATSGDTNVSLSWRAIDGVSSYNVYWANTSGVTVKSGTKISRLETPAYAHDKLTNGMTYYYVATAITKSGESPISAEVRAIPTGKANGVLATGGHGSNSISWPSVSGATTYNIYWSTASGVTTSTGTKISGATSPYSHVGLQNWTTYYYLLTAENGTGQVWQSSELSATPTGASSSTSGLVPKQVSAGDQMVMVVATDGSLWASGGNNYGQLGNGGTSDSSTFVQVVASGVASVSSGLEHTLVVKTDGSLWAFGWNSSGQIGNGTTTNQLTPVKIVASGVKTAFAGYEQSLFVKTDGSLWGMGRNDTGQLGLGDTVARSTPTQILSSGVDSASAGYMFSLIVKTDGSLWGTGYNYFGNLCNGNTAEVHSPVQAIGSGVKSVSAGYGFSIFLKTNGTVWACGMNSDGRVGNGTTSDQVTPVQIFTGATEVHAGGTQSLFVDTSGALWVNGGGGWGQLGTGLTANLFTPTKIVNANVVASSAGYAQSYVLTSTSTILSTGYNAQGQLGNGTTQSTSTFGLVFP